MSKKPDAPDLKTTLAKCRGLVEATRLTAIADIERNEGAFIGQMMDARYKSVQIEGVKWLSAMYDSCIGCILGDEMGMGKTAQVVATLLRLKSKGDHGPFILIVPLISLQVWENEFAQWTEALKMTPMTLMRYHGKPEMRLRMRQQFIVDKAEVLLTTREMLTSDYAELTKMPASMGKTAWRLAIVDEAHLAKNSATAFYKSLVLLQPQLCMLITGTIVHNDLHNELQSLLKLVIPKTASCKKLFTEIASLKDLWGANNMPSLELMAARDLLYIFMLRRIKADHQTEYALYPYLEVVVRVPPTPLQRTYYTKIDEYTKAMAKTSESSSKTKNGVAGLVSSVYKRQIDCHPYIVQLSVFKSKNSTVINHAFVSPTASTAEQALNDSFVRNCLNDSQKFAFVVAALRELHVGGHKTLIFSQSVSTLALLGLVLRNLGYVFDVITGDTHEDERGDRIRRFESYPSDPPHEPGSEHAFGLQDIVAKQTNAAREKPTIMLLSTMAGSVSITLTTADTVIFLDSHANPQNDAQAIGRAHRMGQTRRVLVLRVLVKGACEDLLFEGAVQEKRHIQRFLEYDGRPNRDQLMLGSMRPPPLPTVPLRSPHDLRTLLDDRADKPAMRNYAWQVT